jgi:hypothetical protein
MVLFGGRGLRKGPQAATEQNESFDERRRYGILSKNLLVPRDKTSNFVAEYGNLYTCSTAVTNVKLPSTTLLEGGEIVIVSKSDLVFTIEPTGKDKIREKALGETVRIVPKEVWHLVSNGRGQWERLEPDYRDGTVRATVNAGAAYELFISIPVATYLVSCFSLAAAERCLALVNIDSAGAANIANFVTIAHTITASGSSIRMTNGSGSSRDMIGSWLRMY